MSVQLTPDELREVVLAIDAYKEALERYNATGSVGSSIRALQTAREKMNRECRRVRNRGHRALVPGLAPAAPVFTELRTPPCSYSSS